MTTLIITGRGSKSRNCKMTNDLMIGFSNINPNISIIFIWLLTAFIPSHYQNYWIIEMKRKVIENYSLYEVIGQGMYGKVYRGICADNNQEYAIKVIPLNKFQENPKLEECTANQIKILSKIEPSPYIIRYVEMHKTKNNFYFIYEYCNGRTLEHKLKQETKLSQKEGIRVFKQLLEAFQILNKYNIMHRDLKPDNIFFHNGNIKLGDFGFCKTLGRANDMASTMLGSPIYMAPEVLKGEIYTSKADIWSLGVVLYQMLFGICPFESNSIAKLISVLTENDLNIPLQINNISLPTQNLLKKLLVKDQFKRIDWFELLNYNFYEINTASQLNIDFGKMALESAVNDCESDYRGDQSPMHTINSNPYNFPNPESPFRRKQDEYMKLCPVKIEAPDYTSKLHKVKSIEVPSYQHFIAENQASNSNPLIKKKSLQQVPSKRKNLLEIHNSCLGAVRTAINFMKSEDPNGMTFSLLLFRKVLQQFWKACQSINYSDLDLEDILVAINTQMKQIEKQIVDLEKELKRKGVNVFHINSDKQILKERFTSKEEINCRLWYEMVTFLNEDRINLKATDYQCENSISMYISC